MREMGEKDDKSHFNTRHHPALRAPLLEKRRGVMVVPFMLFRVELTVLNSLVFLNICMLVDNIATIEIKQT